LIIILLVVLYFISPPTRINLAGRREKVEDRNVTDTGTIKTPRATEHLQALLGMIPKHMLRHTVSPNTHTGVLYLRPTILASFLDRYALPENQGSMPGFRIHSTEEGLTFRVSGAKALKNLSDLGLPTYEEGPGVYMFKGDFLLVAQVNHQDLCIMLKNVYGDNLGYGYHTAAKFGDHVGVHKGSLLDPTRNRIDKAYKKGQRR
jgi:hypothetical protein